MQQEKTAESRESISMEEYLYRRKKIRESERDQWNLHRDAHLFDEAACKRVCRHKEGQGRESCRQRMLSEIPWIQNGPAMQI